MDGDGLSTAFFALGYEEGFTVADKMEGIEAVFITTDGDIHMTPGAEELYEGRR